MHLRAVQGGDAAPAPRLPVRLPALEEPSGLPGDRFLRRVEHHLPTVRLLARRGEKEEPGELEARALVERRRQQDELAARQVYLQMEVERRLWEEKMRALFAELAIEILRIWEEVMLRRQQVFDDLADKWSKVLFD